jgi:hypothetical protein
VLRGKILTQIKKLGAAVQNKRSVSNLGSPVCKAANEGLNAMSWPIDIGLEFN